MRDIANDSQSRPIDELRSFPLQNVINGELDETAVSRLAVDIEQRGLQHPIEVLPDWTVLCGHHRLEACRRLGRTEIAVIVRSDLAHASDDELRRHFVNDNLKRNHYGPIAQARLIVALDDEMAVEDGVSGRYRDRRARELLREHGIDISGKTLERRVKLLKLPIAVQRLVDEGAIPQTKALQLVSMPARVREEISSAVLASDDPKRTLDKSLAAQRSGNTTRDNVTDIEKLAHRAITLCDAVHKLDEEDHERLTDEIGSAGVDHAALRNFAKLFNVDVEVNEVT